MLAGSAQRFYGICIVQSFGFVARLGDSGELDPAFGEGGAVSFSSDQLSSANDLVLDGNGNPLVFGGSEACRSQSTSTLLRLASNGPAQTLLSGRAGFSQLAIDSSGRILGLEVGRRNVVIRRLQTNGGADPSSAPGARPASPSRRAARSVASPSRPMAAW